MENVDIIAVVVGGVSSLIISVLKRWITLDKKSMAILVLLISFLVATVIELIQNDFNWGSYVSKIAQVYSSSQVVYWIVLKELELDTKLEGK
jgi:hypothetical protein